MLGVSAIQARVGLDDVWYNYRVANTVNAFKEMGSTGRLRPST